MIVYIYIHWYTLVIITYHILLWSHVWLLHISTFLLSYIYISKSNIIITNCFTPHVCCFCWFNHHLSSFLPVKSPTLLVKSQCFLVNLWWLHQLHQECQIPSDKSQNSQGSAQVVKRQYLGRPGKKHGNWCKYLYVNQQRWWLNQQSWWFNWESSDDTWWFNQQKSNKHGDWTNNHGEWNNKQLLVLPNIGVYSTSFLSTLAKWF